MHICTLLLHRNKIFLTWHSMTNFIRSIKNSDNFDSFIWQQVPGFWSGLEKIPFLNQAAYIFLPCSQTPQPHSVFVSWSSLDCEDLDLFTPLYHCLELFFHDFTFTFVILLRLAYSCVINKQSHHCFSNFILYICLGLWLSHLIRESQTSIDSLQPLLQEHLHIVHLLKESHTTQKTQQLLLRLEVLPSSFGQSHIS